MQTRTSRFSRPRLMAPTRPPGPTRTGIPLWLAALTLAAFATGTDDMVIAGLLPQVSADLHMSEPVTGQLITVYALVYALAAPVCAAVTGGLPRRALLIICTLLFMGINVAMAIAPNFAVLLILRVAAALIAATIVPAALAMVAALAPSERRGRWLSTVTAGITLSLIAGVPTGTWLAGLYGWRSTMIFVAALAALACLGMSRLPDTPVSPGATLRQRLTPLTRPTILTVSAAMTLAGSGGMMGYIYLAPMFRQLSDEGPSGLALLILIFGSAGFCGVLLGGRGADHVGPVKTLSVGLTSAVLMIITLAILANTIQAGGLPFAVLALVTIVWAAGLWSLTPPLQTWLLPRAQGVESAVLALNISGMYLGFAIGGLVGGLVLARWGAAAIPIASAGLLALGGAALLCAISVGHRRERSQHADR